jgi:hypothetical protein
MILVAEKTHRIDAEGREHSRNRKENSGRLGEMNPQWGWELSLSFLSSQAMLE